MLTPPTAFIRTDPPLWVRGPASHNNGWIVLDVAQAERAHFPAPAALHQIPFDLAAVNTPRDAIRFVGAYGLLYGLSDEGAPREQYSQWLAEAHSCRVILDLWGGLRQAAGTEEPGRSVAMARIRDGFTQVLGRKRVV